jgi:hypothetical protein
MTEETGNYAIDNNQIQTTPLTLEAFIRKALRLQRKISLEIMQFPDGGLGFYIHNTACSGDCMDFKVNGDSIDLIAIGNDYKSRFKNEA